MIDNIRLAEAQDKLDHAATLLYEAGGKSDLPMSKVVDKLGKNNEHSVRYIHALDEFMLTLEETHGEKA